MNRIGSALLLTAAVAVVTAGCASNVTPANQPALSVSAPQKPATCPTTLPSSGAKFRYPNAPSSTLVPGSPDHALVCRYGLGGGNDPHPDALYRSAQLDAAQSVRLASALNKAQFWPKGEAFNCPASFGVEDLVLFSYSGAAPIDVLVDATGCEGASNGHRGTVEADAAVTQLDAVVGSPRRPVG
jgi:hypothetical protein